MGKARSFCAVVKGDSNWIWIGIDTSCQRGRATKFSVVQFYQRGAGAEEIETDLSRNPGGNKKPENKALGEGPEAGNCLIAESESLRGEKSTWIFRDCGRFGHTGTQKPKGHTGRPTFNAQKT